MDALGLSNTFFITLFVYVEKCMMSEFEPLPLQSSTRTPINFAPLATPQVVPATVLATCVP